MAMIEKRAAFLTDLEGRALDKQQYEYSAELRGWAAELRHVIRDIELREQAAEVHAEQTRRYDAQGWEEITPDDTPCLETEGTVFDPNL